MDLNDITSHAITDKSMFNVALDSMFRPKNTMSLKASILPMVFQTITTIWIFPVAGPASTKLSRLSRISDWFVYNAASPQRSRTWTCPGSDVDRPRGPCGAWACTTAAHTETANKIENIKYNVFSCFFNIYVYWVFCSDQAERYKNKWGVSFISRYW